MQKQEFEERIERTVTDEQYKVCLLYTSYSLTDEGEKEFVKLMMETASKPIHFFLDFNAVIVNLDKLPPCLLYTSRCV